MSFARDGTATHGAFSTAQTEYAALIIFDSPLWSRKSSVGMEYQLDDVSHR